MNKQANSYWSAILEIAFIVFMFYSNLLMGEYNQSAMPLEQMELLKSEWGLKETGN